MKYIQNSEVLNTTYQDITNHGFAFKQSEKQEFRKRLEILTVEERNVDSELRKAGLGKWNKGLKSSVYRYEKDDSDNENPDEPEEGEGEELENFEDEDNTVIQRNVQHDDEVEEAEEELDEDYDRELAFLNKDD